MTKRHRRWLAVLVALACAACQPSALQDTEAELPAASEADARIATDDAAPAASGDAPASPATPPPPIVEGMEVTYLCGGGELRVLYADGRAHVTLVDGRESTLILDPQAIAVAAGEVYSGEGMTLRRSANTVELREGGQGLQICSESSSTA